MLAAYQEKVIMVNDQLTHLLFSISCESDSPLYGYANDAHCRIECLLSSVQFSSVSQSCPTLCDPMNRSTPGLPVHHQCPEVTQTHVH